MAGLCEGGNEPSGSLKAIYGHLRRGADILILKRHAGWKSSTVAEGYVEESLEFKKLVANLILRGFCERIL
ncbi:hypothetical protein ANN_11462 [Periplaneta americana]|uniref:Uncharacterized protein n=1 Tax=Periplaneta americana TaxID=6978 RepID=A0ABQ8T688_PERAM|nr:hypothetical protein ANN_11462 [Periplaneta americana]